MPASNLFAPLQFACGQTMKNRFMLAPLTNSQSHADGTLSDAEQHWLVMRAQGGFGMTMGEMTTAVMSNIPAIGIVMDNGTWGSEIAYQRDFYAGRYIGAHVHSPRFDEVMKLTGGNGYHPTAPGETADALRDALKAGKPAIIHVKVDPEATISFRKDALQKRA